MNYMFMFIIHINAKMQVYTGKYRYTRIYIYTYIHIYIHAYICIIYIICTLYIYNIYMERVRTYRSTEDQSFQSLSEKIWSGGRSYFWTAATLEVWINRLTVLLLSTELRTFWVPATLAVMIDSQFPIATCVPVYITVGCRNRIHINWSRSSNTFTHKKKINKLTVYLYKLFTNMHTIKWCWLIYWYRTSAAVWITAVAPSKLESNEPATSKSPPSKIFKRVDAQGKDWRCLAFSGFLFVPRIGALTVYPRASNSCTIKEPM